MIGDKRTLIAAIATLLFMVLGTVTVFNAPLQSPLIASFVAELGGLKSTVVVFLIAVIVGVVIVSLPDKRKVEPEVPLWTRAYTAEGDIERAAQHPGDQRDIKTTSSARDVKVDTTFGGGAHSGDDGGGDC